MSAGRKAGFAILGLILGAVAGGIAGLGIGTAYVELAGVTSFEGASGYAVVFWIFAGIVCGAIAGAVIGLRKG
ncbi:MAG: hypothetical protein KDJ73_14915 [Notoacmeibacter sp.]|nr:hypothetical protein [Notoacmeibacter sp.]MCC0032470.1 hypothetical protein [Brucellaceae bacterium]